ncbi:hypothetical protein KUL25_11400 [Rhodobacteraceae bacterium N5(2021)]|uniref:Uncharacterized protein n=1 Tax=Gymnodinialimonas phycosphaerae TaxID=2841589 RepID=A0A975TRB5_9RHOB|nr:hypothetical protein [Gymnodinialimonas phycosphaerae]MBY4893370.1 hypothetical protein [Gymnodinialimonas phycosphaerae]
MRFLNLALVTVASTALPQVAPAQQDIPLVPIGISAEDFDFTGTWNYRTANHSVAGACPNGSPMSGTLEITHSGDAVGLVLTSGATCDPGSMCIYDGAIDDDGNLIVSNTATVDDEGGTAANAIHIFFLTDDMATGHAGSGYVHPSGFECQWSYFIELTR